VRTLSSLVGCRLPPADATLFVSPALAVVGSEELESRSVNVRNRDDAGNKKARTETIKLDEVLDKLLRLKNQRRLDNELR